MNPPTGGSWRRGVLLALGTLVVLGLDTWLAAGATGIAAAFVMFGTVVVLSIGQLRLRRAASSHGPGELSSGVLLLALASLAAARAWIGYQQLVEGAPRLRSAVVSYDLMFVVLAAVAVLATALPERLARFAVRLAARPGVLLAGSFALLIAVSTLLLTLPFAVRNLASVSLIDALFTITSAVCVTGLVVNDVASTYSFFGQLVIAVSIQLGGIGIMTLAALAIAFGRDNHVATQARYAQMLDATTVADLRRMVQAIVVGTFALEAIGAALLYPVFRDDPAVGADRALWFSVFHAISSFCNAGFSLFPDGLMSYRGHLGLQVVIMGLIVLGGLGFPVLRELAGRGLAGARWLVLRRGSRPSGLSLHSRVVIGASAVLISGGAALLLIRESFGSWGKMPWDERLMASVFMSVNARTSGFNTVSMDALTTTTLITLCVLMFIGGSPGSTAGGIKTTTAATLWAAMLAEFRGREPRLSHRAISPELFRRAIAVAMVSLLIVIGLLVLLTMTDGGLPFEALLFETVSAFATVGLSTGITASLSVGGKLVLIAAMFIGRVGPMTIALAVAAGHRRQTYHLPRENIPIG